jgi:hypothetical protein
MTIMLCKIKNMYSRGNHNYSTVLPSVSGPVWIHIGLAIPETDFVTSYVPRLSNPS